ncbi:hypothetical protein Tco_0079335 [Tanacetum coccineum]
MWLTTFHIDGTPATVANVHGIGTTLKRNLIVFISHIQKLKSRNDLTLIRHNGNEQMMRVRMERHKEAPERTNHVNVLGRWRLVARENGFEYSKLIRFRYMHEVEDLDAENEAYRRYPVLHLC